MDFGKMLEELKCGCVAARKGWNGKGMFIYHVPANAYPATTQVAKSLIGETVPYQAYIAMKTVDGTVVPWLASQSDILAEDWDLLTDDEETEAA